MVNQNRKHFDAQTSDGSEMLYEESADLIPFRGQPLTPELLTHWYRLRSHDIEQRSRLVDRAKEFVEIGIQNGVQV